MLSLLNKQTTGSYKTCYILFYLGGITMKFCKYCGAQLEDNAVCNCEKSRAAQAQAQQANAQAQQIVDNAVTEANNIRQGSVQYTDDMLRSLQTIIKHSMEGAQSRFESYMSSMQSSYDVVSSNRNELAGSVVTEPEENTGAEAAAAATQAASGEAAE